VRLGAFLRALPKAGRILAGVAGASAPVIEAEGIDARTLRKIGDGADRIVEATSLLEGGARVLGPVDDFVEETKMLDAQLVLLQLDAQGAELERHVCTPLQRNSLDAVLDAAESLRVRLLGP